MLVLALDTATQAVTVAVSDERRVRARLDVVDARRQGELLAAGIRQVLAEARVAFVALQIVRARGLATDLETVVARDHNVVITVVIQGPHSSSVRYHAAQQSELQSGAIAAAKDVVASLR